MEEVKANTYWIEVKGSGTPECDGLYCPSAQSEATSESGTKSETGYWNGKMAWDRADGKAKRSPSLSYSNSFKAWRIARLDGHLAYTIVNDDELPTTSTPWDVYKKGEAPAPTITIHESDPRPAKVASFNATPNVVFVLGGPGAGKGTVCQLAQQQLGWSHLSAGDLLRAERAAGGPDGEMIESYIVAGKIVPVEVTVGLLRREMARIVNDEGRVNFLIDGFPRNADNLQGWENVMGSDAKVAFMLFFECPLSILEERILGRAKFSGRSDDNVESLRKRFKTYKDETMTIVNVFRERGLAVEVDTSVAKDKVYAIVKEKLSPMTDPTLGDLPLTEWSECLLGLRPYPKKKKDGEKEEKKVENS